MPEVLSDLPDDNLTGLAHVIAEAFREIGENTHIHKYDILDVWVRPAGPNLHPLVPVQIPTTIALLRCRECELPDTTTLPGEWTLEQIRKRVESGETG
jgi:hypothetical protein